MSRRLVGAGYHVLGLDSDVSAGTHLVAAGGEVADTVAQVGGSCDVVILMLPTSAVVEAVLGDGLEHALRPGSVLIDMGSDEPMSTRAIAGRLAAKDVTLVDAPVSGGVTGAEKGTLTVMTGGPSGAVDRVEPLLDVLGTVVRTGPVGSGHAVKALNNLMSATHLWVTSEAILAGERFGLDPQTMLAVFNRSSGRSGSTENKWPNFILPQTYNSGFTVQLMVKDMRIALDLIQQVGGPHALSSSATQLWATAAEELTASADHTEVARFLIHCASSRQQEPE